MFKKSVAAVLLSSMALSALAPIAHADICSADGKKRIRVADWGKGVYGFELVDDEQEGCLTFGPSTTFTKKEIEAYRGKLTSPSRQLDTARTVGAGLALIFLALGSIKDAEAALRVNEAARNGHVPSVSQQDFERIREANETAEVLSPYNLSSDPKCIGSPYGFDRHRRLLERALYRIVAKRPPAVASSPKTTAGRKSAKSAPSRSNASSPSRKASGGSQNKAQ